MIKISSCLNRAIAIGTMFVVTSAYAQPSKTEREDMAKTHEEIAVCLRSDKPFDECHKIMRDKHKANPAACRMFFDAKECPMGSKGSMMRGQNGPKRPMQSPANETKSSQKE